MLAIQCQFMLALSVAGKEYSTELHRNCTGSLWKSLVRMVNNIKLHILRIYVGAKFHYDSIPQNAHFQAQIHTFKSLRRITTKTLVNRLKNLQTSVLSTMCYFIQVYLTQHVSVTVDKIMNSKC